MAAHTNMTNPRLYLLRMASVLIAVAAGIGFLSTPLTEIFLSNIAFNAVIITTALLGVCIIFGQTWRLGSEIKWLNHIQKNQNKSASASSARSPAHRASPAPRRPTLLAPIHIMLATTENSRLSAQSVHAVLDSVAARLDETRQISRYFIGLLVFLGLLGTFWGLLETISAVSQTVGGLDLAQSDFEMMMTQLRNGLATPLAGMATAFSSSLFGLGCSLIIGCLDLQLGQAMGRFFHDVEDWLSSFAHYSAPEHKGSEAAWMASSMHKEGAHAMITLAQAIEKAEADRDAQLKQIIQMNSQLTILNEQMADDKRTRDMLAILNARIEQLTETLSQQHKHKQNLSAHDMRALAEAIAQLVQKA